MKKPWKELKKVKGKEGVYTWDCFTIVIEDKDHCKIYKDKECKAACGPTALAYMLPELKVTNDRIVRGQRWICPNGCSFTYIVRRFTCREHGIEEYDITDKELENNAETTTEDTTDYEYEQEQCPKCGSTVEWYDGENSAKFVIDDK